MKPIIFFVVVVLFFWMLPHTPDQLKSIYASWCKAHPSLNLTYDEWNHLRKEGMLP